MSPLREACVATGMKIGSGTGPCGNFKSEARAFVVYRMIRTCFFTYSHVIMYIGNGDAFKRQPTEHLAMISSVKAALLVVEAMLSAQDNQDRYFFEDNGFT